MVMVVNRESCASTPLLVEVFLPSVGAAVQASFDLDPVHQADVFAAVEALLEKAATYCNGKVTQGPAAARELEKLQATAVQDLAFLQDQFKLVDEWKAKAREAGATLGKMRETYTKEVAFLRAQIHSKRKAEENAAQWQPSDVVLFNPDEFLLANEVAKLISDAQLSACKEKMISMQVQSSENLYLIQRMTERLGCENEQDALDEFCGCQASVEKAEQVIDLHLESFKQDAERQFKLKIKQCQIEGAGPQTPAARGRRASLPNMRRPGDANMRRKSDPAGLPMWNSEKDSDTESASSDDEGVTGLKAKFEAKLKGREKLQCSSTLLKAKDKFLLSIRRPNTDAADNVAKAETNKVAVDCQEQSCQTDACRPFMQGKGCCTGKLACVRCAADAAPIVPTAPTVTFQEQGVNTSAPSTVDRGVNPISMDLLLSSVVLDESSMSIDTMFNDGSEMTLGPRAVQSRDFLTKALPLVRDTAGTNLPRCAGAHGKASLSSKDPTPVNIPASELQPLSESRQLLNDPFTTAYASPFANVDVSPIGASALSSSSQESFRSSRLEPIDWTSERSDRELTPPLSPTTPTSAKRQPRRRSLVHKGKFASAKT